MPKIIISYRRSSYDAIAGRIRDKLAVEYGADAVYMDVDDIPFGTDFRKHINAALSEGDVVVAIVGPKWLGPVKGRKPRIFDNTDPVRIEIETALKRGIAVVPILVDDVKMPKPEELPDSISQFAFHNAAPVDDGRDFHQHMERVIRSLNSLLKVPDQHTAADGRAPAASSDRRRLRWAGLVTAAAVVFGIFAAQPLSRWLAPSPVSVRAIDIAATGSKTPSPDVARPTSITPADIGKRVALVIGNSKYNAVPTLANTVNDALSVSAMFRSLGYSVITRTNVSRTAFINALRAFQDEASNAEIAVVYYAGHALEISGANYLIPTDAAIASDKDLASEAISLEQILSATERAERLRLILLDACRDNPFAVTPILPGSGTRSLAISRSPVSDLGSGEIHEIGLARVDVKMPNTLIAYAAKAGEVARDGDGDHGPFASALVKHLGTPNLDVRIALGRVRDEVLRLTQGQQEPFVYGSLGGEMVSLAASASAK